MGNSEHGTWNNVWMRRTFKHFLGIQHGVRRRRIMFMEVHCMNCCDQENGKWTVGLTCINSHEWMCLVGDGMQDWLEMKRACVHIGGSGWELAAVMSEDRHDGHCLSMANIVCGAETRVNQSSNVFSWWIMAWVLSHTGQYEERRRACFQKKWHRLTGSTSTI